VAIGYIGTVTFSTTDPDKGVILPADYTFTADEGGVHTFTDTGRGETTLITPGDQTITATDTKDDTITGNAIVTVTGGDSPQMRRDNLNVGDCNWVASAFGSPIHRKGSMNW
jgi:adhesin/invasin